MVAPNVSAVAEPGAEGEQVVTQASPTGPLRRVPVQGRSLAKVTRMLDACAALLDEAGYEALTTTLVAERAGVAIGSLYQFFPDKRAIAAALAMRNLDAYVARVQARLEAGPPADWQQTVQDAMNDFIGMHRSTPGFAALRFGDVVDRHLLDAQRDNDEVIAGQLSGLMVRYYRMPDGPPLRLALLVAVQLADALVTLAFRRDPAGDEEILAEARQVVGEYLAHKLSGL
jgi:AcrR family transcriptional regulator